MLTFPTTIDELEAMIANEVQESLHLDYKASAALTGKKDELCKDVSAFANSDGGVLIFGVDEVEHKPVRIDGGIEHARNNREWLENVIQGNIAPKIDDLKIVQIPVSDTHSIYVVVVPRSERAPHQERGKHCYYKRHNFKSSPMEDYEIQDIRNRRAQLPPLVAFDVEIDQGALFMLYVENVGAVAAEEIAFNFSPPIQWAHGEPLVFSQGIRVLSPGRKLPFLYASTFEALAPGSTIVPNFSVAVSYKNPLVEKRVTENFQIDLRSFERSGAPTSDLQRQGKKLEEAVNSLTREVKRIADCMHSLETMAGPTGLDFSFSTWRTLAGLLGKQLHIPKIDPRTCEHTVFQELLETDLQTAIQIRHHFRQGLTASALYDLPDLPSETKARFKALFADVAEPA